MRRTIVTMLVALSLWLGLSGLSGCSGGGGSSGGLPVGTLTVVARALSSFGQPVPNLAIWISGHGPFITNALGEITAPGMPSPYEAVVVNGALGTVDVWPGLTRPDPVFTITLDTSNPVIAMVDGTVTGGIGFPTPPAHTTKVFAVFPDVFGVASDTADPVTGAFSFSSLTWFGAFSTPAQLVGIQYLADIDGNPISFTGYGTRDIPLLADSDALVNQDIVLNPVPTSTMIGTVSLPPGLSAITGVVLRPSTGGFIALQGPSTFGSSFMLPAPVVAGLSRNLLVFAADPGSQGLSVVLREDVPDPAPNLTIVVPDPTGLVLPIDGTAGVTHDTLFQATPTPGGRVFTVAFSPVGSGPKINLHTTESDFSIPDLTSYGIVIPPGAAYTWAVLTEGPLASVDEAATLPSAFLFFPFHSNGSGDAFFSQSSLWTFTFGM